MKAAFAHCRAMDLEKLITAISYYFENSNHCGNTFTIEAREMRENADVRFFAAIGSSDQIYL